MLKCFIFIVYVGEACTST